jgi:hypothetical protein
MELTSKIGTIMTISSAYNPVSTGNIHNLQCRQIEAISCGSYTQDKRLPTLAARQETTVRKIGSFGLRDYYC